MPDPQRAVGPAQTNTDELLSWAIVEPQANTPRSRRRWRTPLRTAQQLLLRLLAQYHDALIGQQARYNVHLVDHVEAFEARLEVLEQRLADRNDADSCEPHT